MDFKAIGIMLAAAAAVVGTIFGLFGAVLEGLAPPSRTMAPTLYGGIASLAALMVLLAIFLVMPPRLSRRQRQWIVPGAMGLVGVLAVFALLTYVATLQAYVFKYPAADPATTSRPSQRYIRGDEYTELGRKLTSVMTLAAAVDSVGGIQLALDHQLLWTEQSQQRVEMRLVLHYVVSVTLLAMALFGMAVAVIRTRKARGERLDRSG